MAEIMGVCGAGPETARRLMDRMEAHVDCSGGLRADRCEREGLALLRFHHGVVNPQPQPAVGPDETLAVAMDGELYNAPELRKRTSSLGRDVPASA
jgi:asparagine synthetase B (glutamine-hydrolysing)